jgi:hypothetical protein
MLAVRSTIGVDIAVKEYFLYFFHNFFTSFGAADGLIKKYKLFVRDIRPRIIDSIAPNPIPKPIKPCQFAFNNEGIKSTKSNEIPHSNTPVSEPMYAHVISPESFEENFFSK